MCWDVRPQLYSPRQELREIEADPSGDYGFGSTPIVPSEYPPATYEQPQILALNDGNNFTEECTRLCIAQCQLLSTAPFYPQESLSWQQEVDVLPVHCLSEKQIPDRVWPIGFVLSCSDESDTTSSGQSSPSIFGGFFPSVADSPPQLPHGASYGSFDLESHQFTPGSFPDRNCDTQQLSRYNMENSSSGIPEDTPPTQLLAGRDSNPTPDYPTTDSNYQSPNNYHCAQQGDQQNISTLRPRRSSVCKECHTPFERAGDLQRHLDTTKNHGPAKGPSCPLGGCKYPHKKFTRIDNFKAHLVKRHGLSKAEAARYVRVWEEMGRSWPLLAEGRRMK